MSKALQRAHVDHGFGDWIWVDYVVLKAVDAAVGYVDDDLDEHLENSFCF